MNKKLLVCAASNLGAPEFLVPLLVKERCLVSAVPSVTYKPDFKIILPKGSIEPALKTDTFSLFNTFQVERFIESLNIFCYNLGIESFSRRNRILRRVLISNMKGGHTATKEAILSGIYSGLSIKPKIIHFNDIEETGYSVAQRLQGIELLSFRGRGRVIAKLENGGVPVRRIETVENFGIKLFCMDGAIINTSREELDGGAVNILLRGSIRPLALENSGVIAHAPWHSQFQSSTPPAEVLSYRVNRVLSPMWQRYECDARSIAESWRIGALVPDYVFLSERVSVYVSRILNISMNTFSNSDSKKFRYLAMAAHGRRWLIRNEKRVHSILKEYRALVLDSQLESSKIPILSVLDEYVRVPEINSKLQEAVINTLKLLDGPLKMSLLIAFLLVEEGVVERLKESTKLMSGYVLLPTKRRRE